VDWWVYFESLTISELDLLYIYNSVGSNVCILIYSNGIMNYVTNTGTLQGAFTPVTGHMYHFILRSDFTNSLAQLTIDDNLVINGPLSSTVGPGNNNKIVIGKIFTVSTYVIDIDSVVFSDSPQQPQTGTITVLAELAGVI
jgi:hypothetical protein